MKMNNRDNTFTTAALTVLGQGLCALAMLIALASMPSPAQSPQDQPNHYRQVNLVSDLPGVALQQDTNLVNSWGTSFSGTSPFWISDNGSGLATLYAVTNDSSGLVQVSKIGLQVAIPGDGTATGQLFNCTGGFNGAFRRFATGSDAGGQLHEIDSPWGVALSPITFGRHGDQLLVGNFGSGAIMSFDAT